MIIFHRKTTVFSKITKKNGEIGSRKKAENVIAFSVISFKALSQPNVIYWRSMGLISVRSQHCQTFMIESKWSTLFGVVSIRIVAMSANSMADCPTNSLPFISQKVSMITNFRTRPCILHKNIIFPPVRKMAFSIIWMNSRIWNRLHKILPRLLMNLDYLCFQSKIKLFNHN